MPPRGKKYENMSPQQRGAFNRKVKREIKERDKPGRLFLPEEWRKWRKMGYRPEQIDYDMCHVFR